MIACPCALGIAIPLARVAGVALAARNGMLIRSFATFERVETLVTLVLDKTGTVTRGDWRLQFIHPLRRLHPRKNPGPGLRPRAGSFAPHRP